MLSETKSRCGQINLKNQTMPELPDLQVFSRNLQKELSGKKLEKLTIVNKSKIKVPENEFKKSLEKQVLKKSIPGG